MKNQLVDLKILNISYLSSDEKKGFHYLRKPEAWKSIGSIFFDVLLIVLSFYLVLKSFYFLPMSLLIIGSRQRAVSNLTHDASHVNLFSNRGLNDFIANVFCALPMFETVSSYRESHSKHHRFLGNLDKDPDSASHLSYGYNDSKPWEGNGLKNYSRLILNFKSLKSSFLGSLTNLKAIDLVHVIAYWTFLAVCLITILGVNNSTLIFLVWFTSKITSYHIIRIVAEFLDHSGLKNDSIINFSRNLPHKGLIRFIFHPNCDTFHIIHHLYPKIPHYNLKRADVYVSKSKDYLNAHHCDSYFVGKHSALDCWTGKCERNLA